ncbi:PucR family transcriptional regulator [Leucobacter albus]|uniref:PucR family transcriptional regulator n=1 Tax=Leucobacter albus TaxID=272210 RepID=A0ABW3TP31_9MICO
MATLSQLLELPDLGLKLLQSGPGDPELSWVSITELLGLAEYLEGGEIIMTTGLTLGADDPGWLDFVAGLSRARVAAIGFGVGVNHDTVPTPLLRAASTYRVALFEIPLPVPFIAVSKAVAGLLRSDELRAARSALQVQLRLLDSARGSQDPAEVLASIAQATGRQLALVSGKDRVLASTQGFQSDGAELVALNTEGTLHLAIAGSGPLTPEGSSVIAAGAMALGFSVRSDRASDRAERERWELLTGRILSGALPAATAEVLAPGVRLPRTLRAVAVQGSPEDISGWRGEPRLGLDRLIGSTEELAGGLARAWQIVDGSAPEAALTRIAQHGLDAVVGRAVAATALPMSVRSAAGRLGDLPGRSSLYVEPRRAQTIWADRDAPFLEAVLGLGASPEHGAIALSREVLGPLAATGPNRKASTEPDRELLCETLGALFASDGQRGPAAAALGIHRNTLRDRIARIERLTGRSLASAADRAELWFALRADELA